MAGKVATFPAMLHKHSIKKPCKLQGNEYRVRDSNPYHHRERVVS
jgi:hypothetical protein